MISKKHRTSHLPRLNTKLKRYSTFKKVEYRARNVEHREQLFLRKLKHTHKFIFALLVFFGFILIWAGAWKLINMTPFLSEPIVSLSTGIIILLLLGYFYKNIL